MITSAPKSARIMPAYGAGARPAISSARCEAISAKSDDAWSGAAMRRAVPRHPACTADADCAATYDRAFAAAVTGLPATKVHLAGLGCGGGQKDGDLLEEAETGARAGTLSVMVSGDPAAVGYAIDNVKAKLHLLNTCVTRGLPVVAS